MNLLVSNLYIDYWIFYIHEIFPFQNKQIKKLVCKCFEYTISAVAAILIYCPGAVLKLPGGTLLLAAIRI